jgi:hypothetical protein
MLWLSIAQQNCFFFNRISECAEIAKSLQRKRFRVGKLFLIAHQWPPWDRFHLIISSCAALPRRPSLSPRPVCFILTPETTLCIGENKWKIQRSLLLRIPRRNIHPGLDFSPILIITHTCRDPSNVFVYYVLNSINTNMYLKSYHPIPWWESIS